MADARNPVEANKLWLEFILRKNPYSFLVNDIFFFDLMLGATSYFDCLKFFGFNNKALLSYAKNIKKSK